MSGSWLSKNLEISHMEVKKAIQALVRSKKLRRTSSKLYFINESPKNAAGGQTGSKSRNREDSRPSKAADSKDKPSASNKRNFSGKGKTSGKERVFDKKPGGKASRHSDTGRIDIHPDGYGFFYPG